MPAIHPACRTGGHERAAGGSWRPANRVIITHRCRSGVSGAPHLPRQRTARRRRTTPKVLNTASVLLRGATLYFFLCVGKCQESVGAYVWLSVHCRTAPAWRCNAPVCCSLRLDPRRLRSQLLNHRRKGLWIDATVAQLHDDAHGGSTGLLLRLSLPSGREGGVKDLLPRPRLSGDGERRRPSCHLRGSPCAGPPCACLCAALSCVDAAPAPAATGASPSEGTALSPCMLSAEIGSPHNQQSQSSRAVQRRQKQAFRGVT